MIPEPVRDEIRDSLPDIYWVKITHPSPDISEIALQPQIRRYKEGYEPPDPPYESVALNWSETGVIEENTPIDQNYGTERFDPAEVPEGHAHGKKTKGRRSYDTLDLIVTAQGNVNIADHQIGPDTRARALAEAVHDFIVDEWKERPLDLFDDSGAPLDESDPTVPDKFADELEVPVLPQPIPGRGPTDVSDQVGAAGAQINAGVELHYVDTWSEFHYLAEEAPVEADTAPYPEEYDTQ